MSLNVSASFPSTPTHAPGRRTEKSPSRIVCRAMRIAFRLADPDWERAWLRPFSFTAGLNSSLVPSVAKLLSVRFILNSERRKSKFPAAHIQSNRGLFSPQHNTRMAGQQLTNREIPLEKVELFSIPPIACIAFASWWRHNRQQYQYLETGLTCSDEVCPNGFYLEIVQKRIQETLEIARRQHCIVP